MIYYLYLQFKLAYVAPESMVVGAGELVDHPKKIALNYLRGYFWLDFFIVLPLPQVSLPYPSTHFRFLDIKKKKKKEKEKKKLFASLW